MKTKTLKFILNSLNVFLFGSFLSFLLLIYLVNSDSYFYNLDFQDNGFHNKIVKYFNFTVYIPIIILILYSILQIIKEKLDKNIIVFSCLFGIIMFIVFDKIIKKSIVIFTDNIKLSLLVFILINGILLLVVFFKTRSLNRN